MLRGNQERYDELRQAAALVDGLVLQVVELHEPTISRYRGSETATCDRGCLGSFQGESAYWPEDCPTTQLLARELGVHLDLEWRR